jgi:hypothetical protein
VLNHLLRLAVMFYLHIDMDGSSFTSKLLPSTLRHSSLFNILILPEKIPLECLSTLPYLITFTCSGARTLGLGTKELIFFRYSTIRDSRTSVYSNYEVVQFLRIFTYRISHNMTMTLCFRLTSHAYSILPLLLI